MLRHLTGWTRAPDPARPRSPSRRCGRALDQPTDDLVADCRYASRRTSTTAPAALRDALGVLCEGALQGMFDAASTFRPDWRAPIQTLSLSALHATATRPPSASP